MSNITHSNQRLNSKKVSEMIFNMELAVIEPFLENKGAIFQDTYTDRMMTIARTNLFMNNLFATSFAIQRSDADFKYNQQQSDLVTKLLKNHTKNINYNLDSNNPMSIEKQKNALTYVNKLIEFIPDKYLSLDLKEDHESLKARLKNNIKEAIKNEDTSLNQDININLEDISRSGNLTQLRDQLLQMIQSDTAPAGFNSLEEDTNKFLAGAIKIIKYQPLVSKELGSDLHEKFVKQISENKLYLDAFLNNDERYLKENDFDLDKTYNLINLHLLIDSFDLNEASEDQAKLNQESQLVKIMDHFIDKTTNLSHKLELIDKLLVLYSSSKNRETLRQQEFKKIDEYHDSIKDSTNVEAFYKLTHDKDYPQIFSENPDFEEYLLAGEQPKSKQVEKLIRYASSRLKQNIEGKPQSANIFKAILPKRVNQTDLSSLETWKEKANKLGLKDL